MAVVFQCNVFQNNVFQGPCGVAPAVVGRQMVGGGIYPPEEAFKRQYRREEQRKKKPKPPQELPLEEAAEVIEELIEELKPEPFKPNKRLAGALATQPPIVAPAPVPQPLLSPEELLQAEAAQELQTLEAEWSQLEAEWNQIAAVMEGEAQAAMQGVPEAVLQAEGADLEAMLQDDPELRKLFMMMKMQ